MLRPWLIHFGGDPCRSLTILVQQSDMLFVTVSDGAISSKIAMTVLAETCYNTL